VSSPESWNAYWPANLALFDGAIVTADEAESDEAACDVAVILTRAGEGTVAGAVYNPVEEIVPHVDPEHPAPLTLHEVARLEVPVTVAWNCNWSLTEICAPVGLTLT